MCINSQPEVFEEKNKMQKVAERWTGEIFGELALIS